MALAEEQQQEGLEPAPSGGGSYTYADCLSWDEDVRAELIDGEIVMMAPPLRRHQDISRNLLLKIGNFLEGKPCRIYAAPFGVRLFPKPDNSDDTVLEPDLVVVCDPEKLDDRGCNGPPDLVIEILSPSTVHHDSGVKFRKYLQAGVREYWILDPEAKTVHACVLHANQYLVSVYDEAQT
ncbi:MAG: Uma2 family endonuclease, partial [Treponema sp.]|nr:Uma2 family endonuclease [Treponema sp.]